VSERVNGRSASPTPLDGLPGLDGLLSWPQVVSAGGRLAMAYRDENSQLQLATSLDGRRWSRTAVSLPVGAMPAVSVDATGTWALSYQVGPGAPMTSVVRLARDGVHFGPATFVSATGPNVHDTALLPRRGGGFDAYYVSQDSEAGFSLYRRRIGADGALGPEQRLTDAAQVGEASKPNVGRLPDGRVVVTTAFITERGPSGDPSQQRLFSAVLDSDAP
jgi:hypothetical protein